MSEKQTFSNVRRMSALPPIADIAECDWDVRFVPKADICSAAISRAGDDPAGLTTCESMDYGDGSSEREACLKLNKASCCAPPRLR